MPLRVLCADDSDAHAAWCALIRAVFPRAGFERWIEWGCWTQDYRAYTLYEGELPVANVSRMRMRLLLDGAERIGWQFGAVCTRPEYRGRGLGRRLMEAALEDCGDDPLLLFANPRVVGFYPRFGFEPREEWIFGAEHIARPASIQAPVLDPADPAVRERIRRLASAGSPCTRRLGARGHGEILLWYLANGFAPAPREPAPGVLVFCEQDGECLRVHELLSENEVDLATLVPALIDAPIRRIRFEFTPERLWPAARALVIDPEPHLYLRGLDPLRPHKFPLLAHT